MFSTVPSTSDGVTANALSSTSIMVAWNTIPPIDQNGVITMYEVMYTPLEDFGGAIGTNTTIVSGSALSVVLIDLKEYVNYSISVRAFTTAGPSHYSIAEVEETFQDGMKVISYK